MSNRRNNKHRARQRRKTLRRMIESGLPHGTKLRLERQQLLKTRRRNLSAASTHMSRLIAACEDGIVEVERGTQREVVLVRKNPGTAAALRKGMQRLVQLAESLPPLR